VESRSLSSRAELVSEYPVAALVRLADADGDGREDVLVHQESGVVGLIRAPGAPLELWSGDTRWESVPWSADVTGDDIPELWVIDEVGDISILLPKE
jgi:hypothetical protein